MLLLLLLLLILLYRKYCNKTQYQEEIYDSVKRHKPAWYTLCNTERSYMVLVYYAFE